MIIEHDSQHRVAIVDYKPASPGNNLYANLSVRFAYLSDDQTQLEGAYGNDPFDSLRIDTMIGDDGTGYQWNFRYETLYRQDLLDLKPRVKLLESTFAQLARWDKAWGDATDFGTWAFRIGKHLGLKVWLRGDERPIHAGDSYDTRSLEGTFAYHLNACLRAAIDAAAQAKKESVSV